MGKLKQRFLANRPKVLSKVIHKFASPSPISVTTQNQQIDTLFRCTLERNLFNVLKTDYMVN